MGRRIEFSRQAAKALMRMDRATSSRIRGKITLLADDPAALGNNVAPLKGGDGLWRLRVGDWRVVYTEDLVVLRIVRIAPRGEAYD
jgi:mRNA interferase RelE/StbE